MQNSYYKITLISVVYFIFLVTILIVFGYTPTNDSSGYLEFADICLKQGEAYPCTALIKGQPFIWNIGIINLISASLWIFHSYWPVLLLMCLMKALTAYFIGRIAALLTDNRTALIATIIFVCYPNNWGDVTMLMSEIPMVFLSLWGIYLILSKKNIVWWIYGGLLLGIANWFRPIAILFIISLFAYSVFFLRKNIWVRMASIMVGYLTFILLVGTECKVRSGYFIYQAESFWFNMADECYDGSPVKPHYNMEMYAKGTPRYIENREQLTCFECNEIWKERSIEWLRNHPIEYLSKIPGRLFYMYMTDYDNIPAFLSEKNRPEENYITLPFRHLLSEAAKLNVAQWIALITTIFYYILLFSAIFGTVIMIKKRRYQSLFLPFFIVVFCSLSLVLAVHGETRFKIPFMPFIIISASMFYSNLKLKTE